VKAALEEGLNQASRELWRGLMREYVLLHHRDHAPPPPDSPSSQSADHGTTPSDLPTDDVILPDMPAGPPAINTARSDLAGTGLIILSPMAGLAAPASPQPASPDAHGSRGLGLHDSAGPTVAGPADPLSSASDAAGRVVDPGTLRLVQETVLDGTPVWLTLTAQSVGARGGAALIGSDPGTLLLCGASPWMMAWGLTHPPLCGRAVRRAA
jgi:hypothetical protein